MTAASAAHGHAGRNRIYTSRTCTARATQPGQFSDDAPTTIVSEIMHVPAPVLTFTGRRSAGDFVLAKILELQWKF